MNESKEWVMMKNIFLPLLLILSVNAQAQTSRFFANPDVQAQAPAAFALQPEASAFVQGLDQETLPQRQALIQAIQADPELVTAVANWETLSIDEQIPFLRKIFVLECQVMGIQEPELVIANGATAGPAFFDFDPSQPGPGRVILNPEALAKEESKYASLSLLLHETRHSAQFQMAFSTVQAPTIFSEGFKAAFIAQKSIAISSFCDFLTLLNEYEAFQFGNYVLNRLTNGKVDLIGMGTFASQYDANGKLKIDLAKLSQEVGAGNLLTKFNELEQQQLDLLTKP